MINIACFLLDSMYEEHRTFESFHKHEILHATKLQDIDGNTSVHSLMMCPLHNVHHQ